MNRKKPTKRVANGFQIKTPKFPIGSVCNALVRFQVLTVDSVKITIIWAPTVIIRAVITVMMEVESASETPIHIYQTSQTS
jgi:hypothetical protein